MKYLYRTLAALALGVIGLVITAPSASADPAASEEAFFAHINSVRASDGKPPLVRDAQADGVARAWSAEMARSGQLSHNPNLKSQVTNWKMLGENVGVGSNTAVVTRALENSPAHRANMVNAAFTHAGVGVVEADGQVWVTEVFKQARTSTPAAAAPAVPKAPAAPAPRATTPPRPRTPAPPKAAAPKPAAPKVAARPAPAAPAPPTTEAAPPVVEPVPVPAAAPELSPPSARQVVRAGSNVPSLRTYVINGIAVSLLGTVLYLLRGPLLSRRTFAGI